MPVKLFNILFLAIKESEYDFLKHRHAIDSTVFEGLSKGSRVYHLKLTEPGFKPKPVNDEEKYFKGRNRFFYTPFSLYLFIRKHKPDVIIVHGFVFPFQFLWLLFFKRRRTKIIVQHHAEKPFVNRIKRWLQKISYSRADAYLFASKELADVYLAESIIHDTHKIYEVMEGSTLFVKKDKPAARLKLKIKKEPVFLWVGRLDENKDPFTVLKAIKKYKETGASFKLFVIYGTNELENEVTKYISENNLADHVNLIGAVDHSELETWFNAADYFIAASHYEGSGYALCEAMACCCLPIITAIPSFLKMTNNGNCALLFEPGNSDALFKHLISLKDLDHQQWSDKVMLQFKNELSFKAIGSKIEALANKLTAQ